MTLYAVQDSHGHLTQMLVAADAPIGALDAFAEAQDFPPYSALIGEDSNLSPEEREGWVYERPDGLTGAIFTNEEIVAVPIVGPVEVLGGSPSGFAVRDAAGTYLTDGHSSAAEALEAVRAALDEAGIEVQS